MIELRAAELGDAEELSRLYATVYPRPMSGAELSWKYRNDFGRTNFVAVERGAIVAHYGGWLRPWTVGREQGGLVVALDAMTAPSHRGQGLFGRLVERARARWVELGASVVLGLPNSPKVAAAQSLRPLPRLFLSRLQAHLSLPTRWPIPTWAARLGHQGPLFWSRRAIAARWSGPLRLRRIDWAELPAPLAQRGPARSLAWLSWRYAERPSSSYRAFVVEDSAGERPAWAILHSPPSRPEVVTIAELHGPRRARQALLATLLQEASADPQLQRIEAFLPSAKITAARLAGWWIRRLDAPVHGALLRPEGAPFLDCAELQWGDFDLV